MQSRGGEKPGCTRNIVRCEGLSAGGAALYVAGAIARIAKETEDE